MSSSSAVESSSLFQRGPGDAERSKAASARRELVVRAQRGDVLALDVLLDQLLPLVTSICRRLAGQAWEDAVQDALIVVFRRLRTLEHAEALTAWVATIARHEALRHRSASFDEPLRKEPIALAETRQLELAEALATLSVAHREVLVLRDLIGLSEQETARLLLVPNGTVKSRLHRARQTFREAWCG